MQLKPSQLDFINFSCTFTIARTLKDPLPVQDGTYGQMVERATRGKATANVKIVVEEVAKRAKTVRPQVRLTSLPVLIVLEISKAL